MRYNPYYRIRFSYNPILQCIGRYPNWQLVLDVYSTSRRYMTGDEVVFDYRESDQWNELVDYIIEIEEVAIDRFRFSYVGK